MTTRDDSPEGPGSGGLAVVDTAARNECGMGPLTVSVSARKGYTLVSLGGEADMTVRDRLREALLAPVRAGPPHLVVDLSGLRFIDSSCLHVLLLVSRTAGQAGGTLGLAAPQQTVARMMDVWGASELLLVYGSVAEAAS